MESKEEIYQGGARIYLQGQGALQPLAKGTRDLFTYYVGSEESLILIKDYREEPNLAAQEALENDLMTEFAEFFNQPANILVTETDQHVEIVMRSGTAGETSPILWMGVIHDGKMPVHNITWETLKPIHNNVIAFAILVND